MLFYRRLMCHWGVFSTFFPMSSPFRITCHSFSQHVKRKMFSVINFQLLKLVKTPLTPSGHPLPSFWRSNSTRSSPTSATGQASPPLSSVSQIHLSPPSGHPPPLLWTPCWRPTSPLPTRQSSTPSAGGQIHPSLPLPRLLVFQGVRGKEGRRLMETGDKRREVVDVVEVTVGPPNL